MSTNEDIKKLCFLSRVEIDDSKINQTTDKIKEIISFFDKLDEFDTITNNANDTLKQSLSADEISNVSRVYDNFVRFEKRLNDLREDDPHKILDNTESEKEIFNNLVKDAQQFIFNFRYQKNGFVIGPRI